jgi:hypothetical protein
MRFLITSPFCSLPCPSLPTTAGQATRFLNDQAEVTRKGQALLMVISNRFTWCVFDAARDV